jgi:hypothetical protein
MFSGPIFFRKESALVFRFEDEDEEEGLGPLEACGTAERAGPAGSVRYGRTGQGFLTGEWLISIAAILAALSGRTDSLVRVLRGPLEACGTGERAGPAGSERYGRKGATKQGCFV